MSHSERQREAAILQVLIPNLEDEGFEVFLHPDRAILPAFMDRFRPAAIAIRGDKKLAIQVVAGPGGTPGKLAGGQDVLAAHPDWELRVIYAAPAVVREPFLPPAREAILSYLDQAANVYERSATAAFLLAWSAFEAAARSLMPDDLASAQTSARLLEVLAFEGHVTPDEADDLRRLGQLRNAAAHGRLDVLPTRGDLDAVLRATQILLDAPA